MSKDARTVSVSEFISFLFKTQLVDYSSEEIVRAHPELKGLSGMQLKTFRDASRPVQGDDEEDWYQSPTSRRSSFNRSRFSSELVDTPRSPRSTYSASSSNSEIGSGQGWRVYGTSHSRQASTVSVVTHIPNISLTDHPFFSGLHIVI